ncbi:hypothetical protein [Endozoicomonas sp. ONNA2]|uniref:hypothetical protein n=1 Tax=Endozoicomonas sp. ONNA2 TaxID=2828741 RepID=UPI002148D580|nr:hypothetical protein [Endozoicomonas sp. ONNA2]
MYSDLQAAFSALYKGAPVGNTIESIASNPKVTDRRLSQAYQQQLRVYLQQGETQAAPGLIDQSRMLLTHIDSLF